MRVLLIEDHAQLAGSVCRELREALGCEISWECDPLQARDSYQKVSYDVAIIDLLYGHLSQKFEGQLRNHEVSLTSRQLLVSGLLAAQELSALPQDTKIVIWTAADANRRLHMIYAYEELGIRVFCSKSSGRGTFSTLVNAILAAEEGREFIDSTLNPYLPRTNSPKLRDTILRDSSKRMIWRALALGGHGYNKPSEITGQASKTIRNLTSGMRDQLSEFDPGIPRDSQPKAQLISYANRNWEFFLDDAVRARFP